MVFIKIVNEDGSFGKWVGPFNSEVEASDYQYYDMQPYTGMFFHGATLEEAETTFSKEWV